MSANLSAILYLVSGVLFILALIALFLEDSIFRAEFLANAKEEITLTYLMIERIAKGEEL